MTDRRQKNIADLWAQIERALDRRDELLAKLVRNEVKLSDLRKRSKRAQKAYPHGKGNGDPSEISVAGEMPLPFRYEHMLLGSDLNDEIPDLTGKGS